MKTSRFRSFVFVISFFCLLTGGCARITNVTASDAICNKSVEVHLVGVNRFEKDIWETMSMTDYWTPGNQLRKSAQEYTCVIKFGTGPCTKSLSKKHPIRKIWKGKNAEYLFVLADLPGVYTDSIGNTDPRRLRLPAIHSKDWGWRTKQIDIRIEEGNIVSLTIPASDGD